MQLRIAALNEPRSGSMGGINSINYECYREVGPHKKNFAIVVSYSAQTFVAWPFVAHTVQIYSQGRYTCIGILFYSQRKCPVMYGLHAYILHIYDLRVYPEN